MRDQKWLHLLSDPLFPPSRSCWGGRRRPRRCCPQRPVPGVRASSVHRERLKRKASMVALSSRMKDELSGKPKYVPQCRFGTD